MICSLQKMLPWLALLPLHMIMSKWIIAKFRWTSLICRTCCIWSCKAVPAVWMECEIECFECMGVALLSGETSAAVIVPTRIFMSSVCTRSVFQYDVISWVSLTKSQSCYCFGVLVRWFVVYSVKDSNARGQFYANLQPNYYYVSS